MPKTIAKTVNKTPKNNKGQITRPKVVSFRVTAAQSKTLEAIHKREPAMNVKSANQRCRKIVTDYLAGRQLERWHAPDCGLSAKRTSSANVPSAS